MASPQADAFHDQVRAFRAAMGEGEELNSVEEMRLGSEMNMSMMGTMPDGVDVEPGELGGVPMEWLTPPGVSTEHALVFFHGGAYVVNSAATHRKLAAHLGVAAGVRVANIDYRLAPEHPFPAAVDDGLAVYRALLGDTLADRVVIAGDSAGGGLTVATLVAAKHAGLPQPAGAVPMSPWVDLEGVGETMTLNADRDLLVQWDIMRAMGDIYLHGASPREELVAPIYADLAGLAPLYVQVGGDETLLDNALRLAQAAARGRVEVRVDVFPEMQHVFQAGVGMLPEADDAVARAGAWMADRLGLTG